MPLLAGDKLGPYEVLAPIGAGGMGEVYKARDPRLNRIVAIKRLKGPYTARFEQEAHAIAALNHPHICQIHDIGPDYLVMEYVEGQPLSGPLRVEEAVRLALQIAEALEEAHGKGVLHRDLKPANILVTAKGSAKLLDFGLAKLMSHVDASATQTAEGTVVGTAAYMSPEQAQGLPLDARSDIFSFGAVLYELLSGHRPFRGGSTVALLSAVLRDEPSPLHAPAPVADVVTRCLAKRAADRFASMAEVKAALDPAASAAIGEQPSIAVLPFVNMSSNTDDEYFSDGLAEEIINFLAQIPELKVIARTSAFAFKGKTEDIRRIANALGVATILEGSVRRSGLRIRVTAQLINAEDGSHLWSQRYDREMADLFDLQDEIAQAIASALQLKLAAPVGVQPYKPSLPAYEALLKARYYNRQFRPDLLPRIKELFERAITLDPKFALAHCEYGYYFMILATIGLMPAAQVIPVVRAHAQKALELDPSCSDGYAVLGVVAGYIEHDWKEGERFFNLAMARDLASPLVRRLYASYHLLPTGRPAEALQQIERALQEDPLDSILRLYRGACFAALGRQEDAFKEFHEILEFNPTVSPAHAYLSLHHLSRGELAQARDHAEKAYMMGPQIPHSIGALAGLLKVTGDTDRADALLAKLQPGDAFGAPRGLATYYWMLGEFELTADWIEKGIDQRDPIVLTTLRLCRAQMRSTPRWAGLMKKFNLPEA